MESRGHSAARNDSRPGSGISVETLMIASLASASAAFAASRILGQGTLVSAAATPVIVALVSEFLRRPVQSVAATAKRIPAVHSEPGARNRTLAENEDRNRAMRPASVRGEPGSSSRRRPARGPVELPATSSREAGWGPIKYSEGDRSRPRWRLALITGLLAFAIVVGLFTVPELVAGRSITSTGESTTFFGGSTSANKNTGSTTVTHGTPATTTSKAKATPGKTGTTTTTTTTTITTPLRTTNTTPTSSTSAATTTSPASAATHSASGVTTQTTPAH